MGKGRVGGFSKYMSTWHRLLYVYWVGPPQNGSLYPNKGEKPINSPTSWRIAVHHSQKLASLCLLKKKFQHHDTAEKYSLIYYALHPQPRIHAELLFFSGKQNIWQPLQALLQCRLVVRQQWLFVLKMNSLHALQVAALYTTDKQH